MKKQLLISSDSNIHVPYINNITYITYKVKLFFKAYKKINEIFFFLHIKIQILSKTQRKALNRST